MRFVVFIVTKTTKILKQPSYIGNDKIRDYRLSLIVIETIIWKTYFWNDSHTFTSGLVNGCLTCHLG